MTTAQTQPQPLSPEFQEAVKAVQEADMLMNSEYEPLNIQLDKENTINLKTTGVTPHTRNHPLSTRSGISTAGFPTSGRANRWVDRMVKVANACNTLVIKNCNLCHVYANRQVEFERNENGATMRSVDNNATTAFTPASTYVWSEYGGGGTGGTGGITSPIERAWHRSGCAATTHMNALEVNLYRRFLFDEESVVDNNIEKFANTNNNANQEDGAEKQEEEEDEEDDDNPLNATTDHDGEETQRTPQLYFA